VSSKTSSRGVLQGVLRVSSKVSFKGVIRGDLRGVLSIFFFTEHTPLRA
jgi:hypothetical protein